MKVSDQAKLLRNQVTITNHQYSNKIAEKLKEKIAFEIGIILKYEKTKISSESISSRLTGTIITTDEKDFETKKNKLDNLMKDLKNPINLLSLLK